MRPCPHALRDLLPHRAPMILLERAIGFDVNRFRAALGVHAGTLFIRDQGVPSYIGLEYMAQTCGCFAGQVALDASQPVVAGFLLGSRNFHTSRSWFRRGETLEVEVEMIWSDQEMSAFDCRIEIGGETVAAAQLNLYKPRDVEQLQRHLRT